MEYHAIYLAVIAVLIVILVYLAAKMARASRVLKEVEEQFGVHENSRSALPRKELLRKLSAQGLLKERNFSEYQAEVNGLIKRAVLLGDFGATSRLREACVAAMHGGKRLRSIVLMEIARAASKKQHIPVDPAEAALFIEYLHSASLVLDDLPQFDNDSERRGRPTLHTATSPAVAQMAAWSLVAAGMQNLCRQVDWIRKYCPAFKNADRVGTKLCGHVGRMLGVFGAAGGQYLDMSSATDLIKELGEKSDKANSVSPDMVLKILYQKTATFFEIAAVTGWLVAGGASSAVDDVQTVGKHLGMAFQVADDIGDMESDERRRQDGKPGWNIANIIGKEAALREMERNLAACRLSLKRRRLWSPVWNEIFEKVREMSQSSKPNPTADPPKSEILSGTAVSDRPPSAEVARAAASGVGEEGAQVVQIAQPLKDHSERSDNVGDRRDFSLLAEGSPKAPILPASPPPPTQ